MAPVQAKVIFHFRTLTKVVAVKVNHTYIRGDLFKVQNLTLKWGRPDFEKTWFFGILTNNMLKS